MTIQHESIKAGEGWIAFARRLSPVGTTPAQHSIFASVIATANGESLSSPLYVNRVLHYDTIFIPTPPVVTPPPTTPGASGNLRIVEVNGDLRTSTLIDAGGFIRDIEFHMHGGCLYVDTPNLKLRNIRTIADRPTANTMGCIQGHAPGLDIANWTHDGGVAHVRGVNSDPGVKVDLSVMTRFGNAAAECNNRDGTGDFIVTNCILDEPMGWPPGDHADGLQFGGARNVTISGNKIRMATFGDGTNNDSYISNSCIGGWAELGNVAGTILIENNDMSGGGSIMYLEQKTPWLMGGPVTVKNNKFGFSRWFYLAPRGLPQQLLWANNTKSDGTPLTLQEAIRDHG